VPGADRAASVAETVRAAGEEGVARDGALERLEELLHLRDERHAFLPQLLEGRRKRTLLDRRGTFLDRSLDERGFLLHHRAGDGARMPHVAVDQLEVEEAPRIEGVLAALHRRGAAIEATLHRGGRDVREIPPAVHRMHVCEAAAKPRGILAQAAEQLLVGHRFFEVGPQQVHVGLAISVVEGDRVPDAPRILAVVLHEEEAIARQVHGGHDHRRVVEEADLGEELRSLGRQLEIVETSSTGAAITRRSNL
jgi:hypothetical protein